MRRGLHTNKSLIVTQQNVNLTKKKNLEKGQLHPQAEERGRHREREEEIEREKERERTSH